MELVESYQLAAEKSGTELNPRLQILPLRLGKKVATRQNHVPVSGSEGGGTSVARLPFLPD